MKGSVNTPTTGHTLFVNISGWKNVGNNMAPHLRRFNSSEVAKERLKIIKFHELHGEKASVEALCIDGKLVYI